MIPWLQHSTCSGCVASIKTDNGGYCRLNHSRVIIPLTGYLTEWQPINSCPKPTTQDQLRDIIEERTKDL